MYNVNWSVAQHPELEMQVFIPRAAGRNRAM